MAIGHCPLEVGKWLEKFEEISQITFNSLMSYFKDFYNLLAKNRQVVVERVIEVNGKDKFGKSVSITILRLSGCPLCAELIIKWQLLYIQQHFLHLTLC